MTPRKKPTPKEQGGSLGVTERVALADLTAYPGNHRIHDLDAIAESLDHHGLYRPVVVQRAGMVVLAGNGTVEAARDRLGWESMDVYVVDVDDDQALRINLVDNQAQALGSTDVEALVEQLRLLGTELEGTLFKASDVDAMEAQLARNTQSALDAIAGPEADVLPEPKVHVSQLGDVWELGDHRLIVGDASDHGTLDVLADGERPDCVWTDPPYGIDLWEGMDEEEAKRLNHRRDGKQVANDGEQAAVDVVAAVWSRLLPIVKPGAPVYVATPPGREHYLFPPVLIEGGFDLRQTLVWVKDRLSFSRMDYHFQHELILYGFTPGGKGEGRKGRGGHRWYGTDNRVTVLEHPKPSRSADHPTMKPVSLIVDMLRNSVRPGGIVLDPFAGSGSTMAACMQVGAKAYMVELAPEYADGICARYQHLTGEQPVRNGIPFDFSA